MSNFEPRLSSAGMSGNSLWYSNNPFYQAGYGLPNCTCYAWGRFWEIAGGGSDKRPRLSTANAEDWYNYGDGYERGTTPKLGAVICFADGPFSGDGHVAIVEEIFDDGSITTSNSAYGGDYFYTQRLSPLNNYVPAAGYIFQGFIYNPYAGGQAPPEPDNWITGNRFLSRAEQDNNAIKFYYVMTRLGFSYNAILGMLANLQSESTINPGIWEGLNPYGGGYGLVQWTPYTKYSDWAGSGWENNGQKECERINYESQNGLQWFGNPAAGSIGYPTTPPVSFAQFKESDLDPVTLADYWLLYYEHPREDLLPSRHSENVNNVAYYDDLLGGGGPVPPVGKKFKWWMAKNVIYRRIEGF